MHGQATTVLRDEGGSGSTPWLPPGPPPGLGDERMVDRLVGAGESALARGAPETAITYLRRAMDAAAVQPVVVSRGGS